MKAVNVAGNPWTRSMALVPLGLAKEPCGHCTTRTGWRIGA
jgi:hypothetical protein